MPSIDLETSTGLGSFHYTLSTPTDANAEATVEGTPTLVLVHPLLLASEIFHPIYADPRLRRFNLLTMDLRGHGLTSASADDTYGPETAARDVLNLMDALKVRAAHVMGLSYGSCVALQMTISAPERVLSLFILSPLPLIEPPEIIAGRNEVWDCWMDAFSNPQNVDTVALTDVLTGGMQLGWNNRETNLGKVLVTKAIPHAIRNWAPQHFDLFQAVTRKFYMNRNPHSVESLARIRCPVAIIHCSEDIAYPIHHAEELLNLMLCAGINAQLVSIEDAPHCGNVTHFEETNDLLYEFLLPVASSTGPTLPPVPPSVESPFLDELLSLGLQHGEVNSDSDEESSMQLAVKTLKMAKTHFVKERDT